MAKTSRDRQKDREKTARYRANQGERMKLVYRKQDYARKFGITVELYEELVTKQGGHCAICGNAETAFGNNGKVRRMAIDHCHETGKVRGVICYRCNYVLGLCKDNTKLLRDLALYVETADTGLRTVCNDSDALLDELMGI